MKAKPNLTRQESIGLAQLKKDKDRAILTVDKGVAMVVIDKEDYINKAQELLAQPTYRPIPKDPTNKVKVQLITKLSVIVAVPYMMTNALTKFLYIYLLMVLLSE